MGELFKKLNYKAHKYVLVLGALDVRVPQNYVADGLADFILVFCEQSADFDRWIAEIGAYIAQGYMNRDTCKRSYSTQFSCNA